MNSVSAIFANTALSSINDAMGGSDLKKTGKVFLMALCIFFSVSVVSYAKTTVGTQKLTLHVGDEKQLKAWKDNVKWSVSDKDCISVSKTGKIQALKKGRTVITAIHGNKKKKFKITVKNSYLNVDFSNAARVTVRHLNYGFLAQIDYDDIINIKKLFEDNVFYRYIPAEKKTVGGTLYQIILYDIDDKILWSFTIDSKNRICYHEEGVYNKYKSYKPKKTPDLAFFESLFEDHSLFIQ